MNLPRAASTALLLALLVAGHAAAAMPAVGDRSPRVTLDDLDGEPVRIPALGRERPVVLLFWTTWCPYCKVLMGRLATLKAEPALQDIEVIAVNFAEEGDHRALIAELALPFRFVPGGDRAADRFGVTVVPALFVVHDGRIAYRLDYPSAEHASQQVGPGRERAQLLGPWWEQRLREVLTRELADAAPPRAR